MRRHALSGPTTKSMKNVAHANAVPASPMRHRSKYELRSISLEGNKVLPWTTRYVYEKFLLLLNSETFFLAYFWEALRAIANEFMNIDTRTTSNKSES